jgi:hypothetical protein
MTGQRRPRKTVDADYIRKRANEILRLTPDSSWEYRRAVFAFAEDLLMSSGQYRGYRSMSTDDDTRRVLY